MLRSSLTMFSKNNSVSRFIESRSLSSYSTAANQALRDAFGTAALPENVPPSMMR